MINVRNLYIGIHLQGGDTEHPRDWDGSDSTYEVINISDDYSTAEFKIIKDAGTDLGIGFIYDFYIDVSVQNDNGEINFIEIVYDNRTKLSKFINKIYLKEIKRRY